MIGKKSAYDVTYKIDINLNTRHLVRNTALVTVTVILTRSVANSVNIALAPQINLWAEKIKNRTEKLKEETEQMRVDSEARIAAQ